MLEPLTPASLATVAVVFAALVAVLWLAARYVPGRNFEGRTLPDGTRQSYRANGMSALLIVLALHLSGASLGAWSLAWPVRHIIALALVANLFAFAFATWIFLRARQRRGNAERGWKGALRDYFFGIDLNPLWRGIDLKMFSYRPSLIGLCLINLGFAGLQWERHGQFGSRMLLFQAFCLVYILNHFQLERVMTSTWDIIEEKFGWMLIWGDFAFVPFAYSITGWFLVDNLTPLPTASIVALSALYGFGFVLFRGANAQKHAFREDPRALIWGKPAETLSGRLLVSGFWGIGRKLNYTGEWCIYCAWTALAGFDSWIPWLIPLWLLALLAHRAARDDARCREKYGALWENYCRRATFRMFPGVY